MMLTFVDTHNMIAYLTKSDASEGFNQIINFLNGSSIKYALTINPNIYVSCIKQFWTSVAVKKVNDVKRLQALVDKKKVIITEATIRDALRLDDAEGIECLPNEEIFAEFARIGGRRGMSLVPLWHLLSSVYPQDVRISMDLLQHLLDISKTLTRRVEHLEQDKIAQALEITKLKQQVKKLERRNKASKLRRLQKVGTSQRVETSDETVMDDVSK
nr:xylulose kinase-1 [Tanacetum cinerariifolium]